MFAAQATGTIVNVSSMSAFVVNVPQHQSAYNASTAGVDQLTRALAVEWIGRGIRVNAVAPRYFLSDMTRQFVDSNPDLGTAGSRESRPDGWVNQPNYAEWSVFDLRRFSVHSRRVNRHRLRLFQYLNRKR